MSNTLIKIENWSKKHILTNQNKERYTALRDEVANGVKRLGKKLHIFLQRILAISAQAARISMVIEFKNFTWMSGLPWPGHAGLIWHRKVCMKELPESAWSGLKTDVTLA